MKGAKAALTLGVALLVIPAAAGRSAAPAAAPSTYNGKYEVGLTVTGACKGDTGGDLCGPGYPSVAIPSIGIPLSIGQRLFPLAFTVASSGNSTSFTGDLSGSIGADGEAFGVRLSDADSLPECQTGRGPTIVIAFAPSGSAVAVSGRWACTIRFTAFNVVTVSGTVEGQRVSGGAPGTSSIRLDNAKLGFGRVRVGRQKGLTFTVNATSGDHTITVPSTTLGPFRVPGGTKTTRAGDAYGAGFYVYFRPTAARNYKETLKVETSDPAKPMVKVVLTGTGVRR
jgi:hypothetical protein